MAGDSDSTGATRPAGSRDDELLRDVPDADHHLGRIAGYRSGSRVRTIVFGILVVSVPTALLLGRWYAKHVERTLRPQAPTYELAPDDDGTARPDTLSWTHGVARLGLSRTAPGVQRIELPDRVIRLAPGHEHAQIRVEIRDGRTVALEVLAGGIEQELTAPEGSPPGPPATAP